MKQLHRRHGMDLALALLLASGVSLLLYGVSVQRAGQLLYTYLPFNLVLAWIPLGLALWLSHLLKRRLWSSWLCLALTGLWLVFLPNSFYIVTDLIHLTSVYPEHLVLASVLFFSFALTGLLLGYSSVWLVHRRLLERVSPRAALAAIIVTLLACSVAIYVGRDLRWNSWDVLLSPDGLLYDLSIRFSHPAEYGTIAGVVGGFFVLLSGMYGVLLHLGRVLHASRPN